MQKYYLFIINNNAHKIYKNNTIYLYKILDTLYHLKDSDLKYGLSLYKQLCDIFSVKLLNNYITDRFNTNIENSYLKLKSNKEKTKVKINFSCIIINSNCNNPEIFKIFNIYNKRIFTVDFKNKRYFWLNDIKKKI